jgi:hypothetical protein
LELVGQVDLLKAEAGTCTIIDFKTGSATTNTDEVVEAYANQLHCYLILAREYGYGPKFILSVVAANGTFAVDPDDRRVTILTERLREVVKAAPKGTLCVASSLATFSQACCSCSFRPRCKVYQSEAPLRWKDPTPDAQLPPDTWGTVVKVLHDHDGPGFDAVYLKDAASRLVCIRGVPARLTETVAREDSQVAFFSVRGNGAGPVHPQNFSLAVPGDPRAGSHSALIVPT